MAVSASTVADVLAVSNTTPLYSQAISMQGANAVQPAVMVLALGGATSLTLALEGSNDLVNWSSITVGGSWSGLVVGFAGPASQGSIAWQYVRLKYSVVGTGIILLSANVTTSAL